MPPKESRDDDRAVLDALVEDVQEVCGIVFDQLTSEERSEDPEERIQIAANEVQWFFRRTEARMLFHDALGVRHDREDVARMRSEMWTWFAPPTLLPEIGEPDAS